MDDQPEIAVLGFVYFDKMVSAAQRSHSTECLVFLDMVQTVQGVQTCPFCKMVRCISRTFTGRDAVPNQLVQLLKLQTLCPEPDSQHPTTNMEPLGRWYSPMRRSRIRE